MKRASLIAQLTPGDLFHAAHMNGATRICIVTSVETAKLSARAITTQETYSFDRSTGESSPADDDEAVCKIDSLHPLEANIRIHLLEIDRRYRSCAQLDQLRLSKVEQRALLDAAAFFASNPLPPE